MLVFFLNLGLIFPCFLSTLEFIQGQYLPSFYNSYFCRSYYSCVKIQQRAHNAGVIQNSTF